MNIRNLIEKIRDSQFLIPAVFIAGSLLLALLTNRLDGSDVTFDLLIPSTVAAARTLTATVAGAIITVAALVFSFSAVTVQLAASQYSPRVVGDFLRDRFQQAIVGLVMGTFTYSLTSLAALGSDASEGSSADWTASTAIVLGIAGALSIVAYIDHVTRRIRIDDTVRRISERTEAAFSSRKKVDGAEPGSWNLLPTSASSCIRAERSGFVQEIDVPELLAALPIGAVARLDVWTGDFVVAGGRLVTVWVEEAVEPPGSLSGAIAIGETRTVEQDPGLGIRELVDIALRALSPGINDPGTAADVVQNLVICIRAAYLTGNPQRVFVADNGARLVAPHRRTVAEHLNAAFSPIRSAGRDQPLVLSAIVSALESLADELAEGDHDTAAIEGQAEAAGQRLQELLAADPISAASSP